MTSEKNTAAHRESVILHESSKSFPAHVDLSVQENYDFVGTAEHTLFTRFFG